MTDQDPPTFAQKFVAVLLVVIVQKFVAVLLVVIMLGLFGAIIYKAYIKPAHAQTADTHLSGMKLAYEAKTEKARLVQIGSVGAEVRLGLPVYVLLKGDYLGPVALARLQGATGGALSADHTRLDHFVAELSKHGEWESGTQPRRWRFYGTVPRDLARRLKSFDSTTVRITRILRWSQMRVHADCPQYYSTCASVSAPMAFAGIAP